MASELAAALAKVQAKLKPIGRNAEGQAGNRRHKYADLAAMEKAVFPLLDENGLAFICLPTMIDGQFVMAYSLVHAGGEERSGVYPMPDRGTSQQVGSAITYARRYALGAITGAVAEGEDDDAAEGREFHMDRSQRRGGSERYTGWDRPSEPPVRGPRPGAEHEQLRHEPPAESVWDGEDHWKDQPAGPPLEGLPPKPERSPRRKLTPAQVIAIHFGRLGVKDDTERLVKTTILAGLTDLLQTTNDLDEAKQREIGDELAKLRDRAALDALLASKRAEVPS